MLKVPRTLASSSNPVFRFELSKVRRLSQPRSLQVFGRWVFGIALGVTMLWWGILLVSEWNYAHSHSNYPYPSSFYDDASGGTLWVLFILAVLVSLVGDYYYLIITLPGINRQVRDGQWDLLRLTPLREERILGGIYAGAEVRARRVVVVEMAVRFALAAFIVIMGILPPVWIVQQSLGLGGAHPLLLSLTSASAGVPMSALLLIMLVILGLGYCLEPLWRMRTMLTVGLATSARFRQEPTAGVAGMSVFLVIRLAQAGILATILYFEVYFGNLFYRIFSDRLSTGTMTIIMSATLVMTAALVAALTNRYFHWVKKKASAYLWRWAFRTE